MFNFFSKKKKEKIKNQSNKKKSSTNSELKPTITIGKPDEVKKK